MFGCRKESEGSDGKMMLREGTLKEGKGAKVELLYTTNSHSQKQQRRKLNLNTSQQNETCKKSKSHKVDQALRTSLGTSRGKKARQLS